MRIHGFIKRSQSKIGLKVKKKKREINFRCLIKTPIFMKKLKTNLG